MSKNQDLNQIRKRVGAYVDGLVDFLSELIKTPSVNGRNSEDKIANLISDKAMDLNLPTKFYAKNERRQNVFVGQNFSGKSELLFIAHIDTVPEGDREKWKHDPFGAEVEGGKLFGRGAIDCKAGIALSLYTLKILGDLGKGNIAKFIGVSDEESGADSKIGTRYLLEQGLRAKSAIYTYPGFETVTIGHRGMVRMWVTFKGESAHTGSLSWQKGEKGASAIEAIAKFVNSLSNIEMKGRNSDFPEYKFKHTATLVEGGSGESIVPDKARVLIDARLLPNHDNSEYINTLQDLARKLTSQKILVEFEVKTNIPGVIISRDEQIVKILKKLDEEVTGITPEVRGCGPANEGYMLVGAGIPTICGFGAGGDGVHSADEYVDLSSLSKILEIYVRAALELNS